jgi:hypothetical protein
MAKLGKNWQLITLIFYFVAIDDDQRSTKNVCGNLYSPGHSAPAYAVVVTLP